MALLGYFKVGFGWAAENSILFGISTLACVLHGFGAMGAWPVKSQLQCISMLWLWADRFL